MEFIKKLPGMGSGSTLRVLAITSVYIAVLACFGLAIIGGLTGMFDDDSEEETVAAAPTSTPVPPDPTATPKPDPTPKLEPDDPVITDNHIEDTLTFMEGEPQVRDIHISIDDDTVTIAAIIDAATNEGLAQDILDSAVRYLASQVAMSYDKIDSPTGDDLGDIWNHYTLQVGAGPSPDDFYARGAKVPNSPVISWD